MCDSGGTNLAQVTTLDKNSGSPRWSPSGQQIDLDGANPTQLIAAEQRIFTATTKSCPPDSSLVAYFGASNFLWRAPIDGGIQFDSLTGGPSIQASHPMAN